MIDWVLILILSTPFNASITTITMLNEAACDTAGKKYIEFIKYNTAYVCIRRD